MNKKSILISIALAMIVTLTVNLLPIKNTGVKVTYVNNEKILKDYEPLQNIGHQLDSLKALRSVRLDTLAQRINLKIDSYKEEQKKKTARELEPMKKELMKMQTDYKEYSEVINNQNKEDQIRLTKEAIAPLQNLIKEYGAEKGYDYILGLTPESGLVLYQNTCHDITDELLEYINQ